ncbi:hypothetical protein G9274_001387 [Stenotrophomonas rhizophila]|jgi:hypothetical protein|nr:hypothetical protein G9274_001387 [Stenotrophomonas rhizophila]
MRVLSDKWNPRLWLREWLNRPSLAELEERRTAEAAAAQMFKAMSTPQSHGPKYLADGFSVTQVSEGPSTREPEPEPPPTLPDLSCVFPR